ncbi:hypothetical protein [uncultured Abyssibacter sp.]|uniref:hypothetical protein n=1 Tax=uncultured Abyssibacter sp. TaxID=2320202 RepID=UPI0032B2A228
MKSFNLASTVPALLVLAACGSDSAADDLQACTMPLRIGAAVISLDQARGSSTDAVIGEVLLSDFTYADVEGSAQDVFDQSDFNSNVTVETDGLRCVLPCSFGIVSEPWEFSASAPGYLSTTQQIDAQFTAYVSSCPGGTATDGTHATVYLDEESAG